MKLSNKITELTQIIAPAVAACDVALWGVEFSPQGGRSMLRIYIEALPDAKNQDKQVTIEDCAAVTHQVSGVLEVHDPIAGEYVLEVSSPGLDRSFFSLEQMQDYVGETVQLRLIHPVIDGDGKTKRRKMTGKLTAVNEHSIGVTLDDGQQFTVQGDNLDKASLIYSE